MYQKGTFNYLKGDDFRALELSYVGQELSLVMLLPEKVDGLTEFEKTLTEAKLTQWLGQMRPEDLRVWLPRFKITSAFNLKGALSALGMPAAFQRGAADFSGINEGKEGLFISEVVHKAFVDVNHRRHHQEIRRARGSAAVPGRSSFRVPDPRQPFGKHPVSGPTGPSAELIEQERARALALAGLNNAR